MLLFVIISSIQLIEKTSMININNSLGQIMLTPLIILLLNKNILINQVKPLIKINYF